MTLLEVRNLNVNYRSYWYTYYVLDDVGLNVAQREKIGLIGESGSGKTTLLKSVLQILPPQGQIVSGRVLWKGVDLIRADKKYVLSVRKKEIGMIFQDPLGALNPVFKIKDQMIDILKQSYSDHNESDLIGIADELLRKVMLPDTARVLDSYPFQLSGGMRQRVVIAMALASAKDLLLADEPTTNLDVTIQDQILRLINKLVEERGLSMVLVSHALGMVAKMTRRVYVMYAGNIIEEALTPELFREPLHPYTRMLIDSTPRLASTQIGEGIKGNPPDYRYPPSGCRFHPRCPHMMEICKSVKPSYVKVSQHRYVACHMYHGESPVDRGVRQ
ncbi:MAG: ABC transporter ATP-binding protein [Zestosphaera sp.]